MTILNIAIQLMSGAMMLLFSVRFMRIGIERLWSSRIESSLNENSSIVGNILKGTGLGFALQGATVVMLMAAGLSGAGSIPVSSAVILALGADLGSALAVQFLQLPISALGPLAILIGATAYLRSDQPRTRNLGRVVLGLGLIFLSLSIIRSSVAPIRELEGTSAVVGYLNADIITAVIVGIVLTLIMHSSVAAILTAVAFSAHSDLEPIAAAGFVLGCNVGSALLPIWLLKYENQRSRIVPLVVAIVRCGMALVLILGLSTGASVIEPLMLFDAGQTMLVTHLGFNALLIVVAPLSILVTRLLERRLVSDDELLEPDLPEGVNEDISLVTPVLKRKLSGMLDTASMMLSELISDNPDRDVVVALEKRMNACLASMRHIYTRLPERMAQNDLADIQQLLDFAIRVERCGDVFAGKYLALRIDQVHGDYRFTAEGQNEISELVDAVRQTIILAQDTLWTSDVGTAERLVRHKQYVADMEQDSRAKHLARIRKGNLTSLGSSDQHLEMIAALKEINSKFSTIGYAVLGQIGGLKKSRIKAGVSST